MCLETIIGISRTTCNCLPTLPDGYDTADSGLFLHEVEPLNNIELTNDCSEGSIWDILYKAREFGLQTAQVDLTGALMNKYQQRVKRYVGGMGLGEGRNTASTSHTYVGARVMFNPVRGGIARINGMGTIWPAGATAGTIEVSIYNSLNQLVATRDVTISTTGTHTTTLFNTPVELPTFIEYAQNSEYFFVYEFDQANKPKQNKAHCCCSGGCPAYNTNGTFRVNQRDWTAWAMLGGWSGNVLNEFDSEVVSVPTDNLYGLTLNVEIGCDVSASFCPDVMDYRNDPSAMSIAMLILYASALKAGANIVNSTKLSRENTINRNTVSEAMKEWAVKYKETLDYLRDTLELTNNDCLACKDKTGYKIETIGMRHRLPLMK